MSKPAEGSVLTQLDLNRTYLNRQGLLRRTAQPVREIIAHLVGMQSQVPRDPFIGLWTRLEGFAPDHLDTLMERRETVRILTMRGTIHLLTREDAQLLWPLMQADLLRFTRANRQWSPHYVDLDCDEVIAFGRAALTATPSPIKAVREQIAERWPGRDPEALVRLVHFGLPLVQIPPRGLWKRSMMPTVTPLDAWLGEPTPPVRKPEDVIVRYLRAFGPASTADFRTWSRLTGMKQAFARLRSQLVTYRDDRGRELLDVPGADYPDPETPVPVRFLPGFDNALLSHDDRSRIIPDACRTALASKNGLPPATFLVDGFVAGTWRLTTSKQGDATIAVTLLNGTVMSDAIRAEALALLRFLEPDAGSHQMEVAG